MGSSYTIHLPAYVASVVTTLKTQPRETHTPANSAACLKLHQTQSSKPQLIKLSSSPNSATRLILHQTQSVDSYLTKLSHVLPTHLRTLNTYSQLTESRSIGLLVCYRAIDLLLTSDDDYLRNVTKLFEPQEQKKESRL